VLREQGGSTVVAGQRFAIKAEGTPLAPTMNLAGNPMFTPGAPNGWPGRSAGATVGVEWVKGGVALVATIVALVLV